MKKAGILHVHGSGYSYFDQHFDSVKNTKTLSFDWALGMTFYMPCFLVLDLLEHSDDAHIDIGESEGLRLHFVASDTATSHAIDCNSRGIMPQVGAIHGTTSSFARDAYRSLVRNTLAQHLNPLLLMTRLLAGRRKPYSPYYIYYSI